MPFYLRSGKRLAASRQRVSLILREPPGPLAGQLPRDGNVLSFSLAGDGEIDLSLVAKKPGPATGPRRGTDASIPLASLHGADPLPPYVRLIHDVLLGDRSLFTRPDGLAAVWDVADPLLSGPPRVSPYAPWIVVGTRSGKRPGRARPLGSWVSNRLPAARPTWAGSMPNARSTRSIRAECAIVTPRLRPSRKAEFRHTEQNLHPVPARRQGRSTRYGLDGGAEDARPA